VHSKWLKVRGFYVLLNKEADKTILRSALSTYLGNRLLWAHVLVNVMVLSYEIQRRW